MAARKTTEEAITTSETTAKEPGGDEINYEERIPYTIPFDRNNNDAVFTGWNCRNFRIQRGVEVMIPRGVVEILEQSQKQDVDTWRKTQKMEADFIEDASRRGL